MTGPGYWRMLPLLQVGPGPAATPSELARSVPVGPGAKARAAAATGEAHAYTMTAGRRVLGRHLNAAQVLDTLRGKTGVKVVDEHTTEVVMESFDGDDDGLSAAEAFLMHHEARDVWDRRSDEQSEMAHLAVQRLRKLFDGTRRVTGKAVERLLKKCAFGPYDMEFHTPREGLTQDARRDRSIIQDVRAVAWIHDDAGLTPLVMAEMMERMRQGRDVSPILPPASEEPSIGPYQIESVARVLRDHGIDAITGRGSRT